MKRHASLLVVLTILVLASGCGGKQAAKPAGGPGAGSAGAPAASEAPPLPADVSGVADLGRSGAGGDKPGAPTVAEDPAGGAGEAAVDAGGTVAATGELVSPVRSELAVRLPGRVGRVMVDEGARVRRGQPLLELETQYLRLDLERAEADLARARAAAQDAQRDLGRKQELVAKGSVSQAAYDRSKSAYDAAQAATQSAVADRDLARQRLADAVLRSPIDGVVAERRTDVGERLGDSSVAFVVAQTSPLKLRFRIPERYLSSVRLGQAVTATVDPWPGETFRGRVTQVNGVVDSATRTVAVETEFANRDGRLSPGLFARVELRLTSDLTPPEATEGSSRGAAAGQGGAR